LSWLCRLIKGMPLDWDSRKLSDLRLWLKGRVTEERFRHTEGVAVTAAVLAEKNGVSVTKAVVASYLHDSAKHLTLDQSKAALAGSPFRMDAIEKALPPLWHCSLGAALAWKTWKVRDPAVLEAVRWHALGAPRMGLLAQVLFVADYVEPARQFTGVASLRRLAHRDLHLAVQAKCAGVLTYLARNRLRVHPRLIETWNAFLETKTRP
jgi:predicted HD superfamily hydrolase involved in NAD metabolism